MMSTIRYVYQHPWESSLIVGSCLTGVGVITRLAGHVLGNAALNTVGSTALIGFPLFIIPLYKFFLDILSQPTHHFNLASFEVSSQAR